MMTKKNSGFTTKILRGGPEIVNIFLGDGKILEFSRQLFQIGCKFYSM